MSSKGCKDCKKNKDGNTTVRYDFSLRDFVMGKKKKRQTRTKLVRLPGGLTFRPWGFEYQVNYMTRFLHLYNFHGTPLHQNKKRSVMVYCVSGFLLFNGMNRHRMLGPGDTIILDKNVFYSLGAAMGDAQALELQNPPCRAKGKKEKR